MYQEGDIVKIRGKNLEGKFVCFAEEFVLEGSIVKKKVAVVDINGERNRFDVHLVRFVK